MASDMVVALEGATTEGQTLFGHNSNRPAGEAPELVRVPGRAFAPGEMVVTSVLKVPQIRQTATVLASRALGAWGYQHGVNQHGVAVGLTRFHTRLISEASGLTGPELTRLALERAHSARQAIDLLTDLVNRHGERCCDGEFAQGSALMVADGKEAFVLATCGKHWALQAVGSVRALGEVCHVRKDWDRISRGLADLAIERGWWPGDGSKLDFAGAVGLEGPGTAASFRRWGQSTLKLEQQSGQIDGSFLRRLLADHSLGRADEADLRADPGDASRLVTACSLVAQLGGPSEPQVGFAFGSPCASIYFPLSFDADPPAAFSGEACVGERGLWRRTLRLGTFAGRGPRQRATLREALASLQARLDHTADEFHAEAAVLRRRGELVELHRLADSFLQHNYERWEEVHDTVLQSPERRLAAARIEPPAPVFVG